LDILIVTMNDNRDIIQDGAVAVEGNQIVDVGESSVLEERHGKAGQVVDAAGMVVFPGFINLHTHAVLTVLRGHAEDIHTVKAVYELMFPMMNDILTPEDCYMMGRLGALELLRFGSTTIVENSQYMQQVAQAVADVGNRAWLCDFVHDADMGKIRYGTYEYHPELGDKTLQTNIELVEAWHAAADGRIRCLMGPHAADTCTPELLARIRSAADKYEVGVTYHLAQNTAEVAQVEKVRGTRPVHYLEKMGLVGPQVIGGHGIFLDDGEIERLAATGTSVSHNPVINAKRGYIAPVSTMLNNGVNVGLGTDNMAGDIVEAMRMALCVYRVRTNTPDQPKPEQIMEMVTINGARALGMEGHLGSVEPGKLADLVLIDYRVPHLRPVFPSNVIANLIHTGLGSDVHTVIVDGEIVVRNHQSVKVDEHEVVEAAQAVAERAFRQLNE